MIVKVTVFLSYSLGQRFDGPLTSSVRPRARMKPGLGSVVFVLRLYCILCTAYICGLVSSKILAIKLLEVEQRRA